MILSLQGCMAAGKTTAARYLQQHATEIHVSFEDNAAVVQKVKERGLKKMFTRTTLKSSGCISSMKSNAISKFPGIPML